MTENERIKKHIEDCEHRIGNILGFMESNSDADIFSCEENIAVLKEVIIALEELQQYRAIGTIEELQKSVKEEDVLKFYYIESEDKYVVGKRIDTLYYAEVGKTGLCFYMSRYLPWGKDGYSSEPKEIPFFDWLQGFMKKEYGGTIEEFKALKEKMQGYKNQMSIYAEQHKVILASDVLDMFEELDWD